MSRHHILEVQHQSFSYTMDSHGRNISADAVESSLDNTQLQNWSGSVPVVVTLSPTCVSSPTLPAPIHQLVPRHAYLHAALKETVLRLYQFAPITLKLGGSQNNGMVTRRSEPKIGESSSDGQEETTEQQRDFYSSKNNNVDDEDHYPICWFEDEDSKMALRWHLFVGVLYDLVVANRATPNSGANDLPWKIRLHFGNYSSLLLPLESSTLVLSQVHFIFKNSLKQALCLLAGGSNKTAMGINKETHGRLWEAVHRGHGSLYQQAILDTTGSSNNSDDGATTTKYKNLPVRLLLNNRTPLQKQCPYDTTRTLGDLLDEWVLMPDTKSPPTKTIQTYRVAGVSPPLDTSLVDLWQSLAHPDLFLYIIIRS